MHINTHTNRTQQQQPSTKTQIKTQRITKTLKNVRCKPTHKQRIKQQHTSNKQAQSKHTTYTTNKQTHINNTTYINTPKCDMQINTHKRQTATTTLPKKRKSTHNVYKRKKSDMQINTHKTNNNNNPNKTQIKSQRIQKTKNEMQVTHTQNSKTTANIKQTNTKQKHAVYQKAKT